MNDTLKKISDIAAHPREWWDVNKACNAASFGIDDMKSALSQAEDHARTAVRAGNLLKLNAGIQSRLQEALSAIKEVKERVDQLDSICKGIAAYSRIKHAIDFLNQPQAIERDPEGAARAFGQLFVGIGHFCKYVGPLKPWGQFFENMGDFFVNVAAGIVPETQKHTIRLMKDYDRAGHVDHGPLMGK